MLTSIKNIWIPVLLLLLCASPVKAGEKTAAQKTLTVDELLASGYRQLNGQQLIELMNTKKIVVTDIATDKVSISGNDGKDGIAREFRGKKDVAEDKTLYFLDTRLLARAPPLQGDIRRRIIDDELVATDGVRTYHYRVYEKNGRMFAARDIDNGSVYYEVKTR